MNINIPDGHNKVLRVFSANSMIAERQPEANWFVLKKGCVRCGKCCMDFPIVFGHDEKGHCPYLEIIGNEVSCTLQGYRPFGCCIDNPRGIPEYCSIEYEEVK
jgi:hypothetical protein